MIHATEFDVSTRSAHRKYSKVSLRGVSQAFFQPLKKPVFWYEVPSLFDPDFRLSFFKVLLEITWASRVKGRKPDLRPTRGQLQTVEEGQVFKETAVLRGGRGGGGITR